MIKLNNIEVEFEHGGNTLKAVDDVSLEVERGDIYGIVGFSGAGKSTLVRTINLLQKPTKGSVVINNKNITDLSEKQLRKEREKIGMIFQHFNLMQSRTVFDNVAYPLKNSNLSKEKKAKRVNELLDFVDIHDKSNSYPSQLSGGQKQRVAIARALANNPDILLCDEATSALDPQTTSQILKLLKKLNQELNLTIVIITHEMQVVKEICNKVAVMEKGKVVEYGKIFDVFARPKKNITKKFIDSVNHADKMLEDISSFEVSKNLSANKRLLKIKYLGEVSQEPLIADFYKRFKIISNIIWGNMEVLGGKPIGNLVIVLEGDAQDIENVINEFLKKGTIVEEIIIKKDEEVYLERK